MQKSTVALRKAQGPADGHTDSKQAKRISTEGLSSRQRQETQASEGKSEGSSLSYTRPCSRNTNRVIHFAKNEERENRNREKKLMGTDVGMCPGWFYISLTQMRIISFLMIHQS